MSRWRCQFCKKFVPDGTVACAACAVDHADELEPESFDYTCNACGGSETLKHVRGSYVCPWCGDGVMQVEDSNG